MIGGTPIALVAYRVGFAIGVLLMLPLLPFVFIREFRRG